MPVTDRDPEVFTPEEQFDWDRLKVDENGRIKLIHFCNFWLGEQGQYVSRHVKTYGEDYPYLAEGLDYVGKDQYDYAFTVADAREFIIRLRRYRWSNYLTCR